MIPDLLDSYDEPVLGSGGEVGEPHRNCQALCSSPSCTVGSCDNMETANKGSTADMARDDTLVQQGNLESFQLVWFFTSRTAH